MTSAVENTIGLGRIGCSNMSKFIWLLAFPPPYCEQLPDGQNLLQCTRELLVAHRDERPPVPGQGAGPGPALVGRVLGRGEERRGLGRAQEGNFLLPVGALATHWLEQIVP